MRRGQLDAAQAAKRIDATGMVVAPGFIDIQGSRATTSRGDGRDVSKLTQGVTTEILGEAYTARRSARCRSPTMRAGHGDARDVKPFQGAHGFDAWLRAMEAHGISQNVGSFVGASTIRQYGWGCAWARRPAAQLDSMRAACATRMEDGAFGLGSALIYPPGNYASTEELIEVAKAMAPYGGIYITHMRSEADQLLEAIDEAIRIGQEGGVPVEIYHLKAAGEAQLDEGEQAMIAKIDSARAAGHRRSGEHVSVHGRRHGTRRVPAAVGVRRRKAVREPRRRRRRARRSAPRSRIRRAYWENLCEQATPAGRADHGVRESEQPEVGGQAARPSRSRR